MTNPTIFLTVKAPGLATSFLLLACVSCAPGGVLWQRLRIDEKPTIAYEIHAQEATACGAEVAVTVSSREPVELELALMRNSSPERIVERTYPEGTHRLLARLSAGDPSSSYRLQARFADGHVQVREGTLGVQHRRLDTLPLAQVLHSGVVLADGHLVTEQVELDLGGSSGVGAVARAYSSTLAEELGPLGYGWRSNLHHVIHRNACGDFIVTAGNQTMWFRENATGEFVPTRGFHGTLRREGEGTLAFYGKNGTRWVFEHASNAREIWWLVEVASPGQETTRWVYGRASEEPLLERVEFPDGTTLEVHHRRFEAHGRSRMMISEWSSQNSGVIYRYDGEGLLSTATELGAAGTTTWKYSYTHVGGVPFLAREESRNHAGELLYRRDFRYEPSTLLVGRPGGGDYALSTPRVTRIVDSAGEDIRFAYSGPVHGRRWQNAATTVHDGERTVYRFDADGAPVATETTKGIVERVWDRSDLLLTSVVTEDGARSEYEYDRYGNVIRAREGEEITTYRYYPPDRFEPPYIKDRVSEVEDRSGRRYYCYDRHGRQVGCPNV